MQRWVVICAFLTLVSAYECPDGGRCEVGNTCCHDPANGYECCPFEQAECCEDHDHCCPAGTLCDTATSSCVNSTASIPWIERTDAKTPRASKSYRMIKSYMGEEDDNICPDQSRCPAEFSCLRALTKFGCCPLAQGIPCPDGKHCCPEGHRCSADCRSCIKEEAVTTVLCADKVSECPDGMTCCQTLTGEWGCCPMPNAVCCSDKVHCCPEGETCDVEHSKCISPLTKKVTPMWAKLPARIREEWENKKEGEVTAQTVHDEKPPEVTSANTVPPTEREVPILSVSQTAPGNDVICNGSYACPDGYTCCKTKEGDWACCPLPEAVCCEDFIHCCPKGKKCNLPAQTCDDETCSVPMVRKVPTIPLQGARVGDVPCDDTHSCLDGTTCCKLASGEWGCCPLAKAVCCEDHVHCCPEGTICDVATSSCLSSASTPMQRKVPASSTTPTTPLQPASESTGVTTELQTTAEYEDEPKTEEGEGTVQCDPHTYCPESATCCYIQSVQKYGCCPLPDAVCCSDGSHCCPKDYKCSEHQTCTRGEVVIPWYTKVPAITDTPSYPGSVHCDDQTQCPEHTTCCQLSTGDWGCCPLDNAVCCQDKKHCCPEGYTCNIASGSCQKLIKLQLEMVPLTLVLPPEPELRDVKCDDTSSCEDGQTCCKLSDTTWGCCPFPDAVCCSDRLHCCPKGYTCNSIGDCIQDDALSWLDWRMFSNNKKRALIV